MKVFKMINKNNLWDCKVFGVVRTITQHNCNLLLQRIVFLCFYKKENKTFSCYFACSFSDWKIDFRLSMLKFCGNTAEFQSVLGKTGDQEMSEERLSRFGWLNWSKEKHFWMLKLIKPYFLSIHTSWGWLGRNSDQTFQAFEKLSTSFCL